MELVRRRAAHVSIVCLIALVWLHFPRAVGAQQMASSSSDSAPATHSSDRVLSAQDSPQQTGEILRMLAEMRQELKGSRQEIEELKQEVAELREELAADKTGGAENLKEAVDQLRDDQEIVQSQVKTLEQTKVGTASRYPLRITGMILFNSFAVDGAVDNPILPLIALPRRARINMSARWCCERSRGMSRTGMRARFIEMATAQSTTE